MYDVGCDLKRGKGKRKGGGGGVEWGSWEARLASIGVVKVRFLGGNVYSIGASRGKGGGEAE